MRALTPVEGTLVWQQPPFVKLCGAVRGYSTKDGSLLWTFDTNRDFDAVNGVKAHGGGMDDAGPVAVDGMVYVASGSGGLFGRQRNVLLAFGLP
jgi:polyvinyl alcohol dehydrogenase (cytochrome)